MKICKNCGSPTPATRGQCPRCGSQSIDSRSDNHTDRLIGSTLADKYLIEDRLGSGGMCDVYRARHVLIGKQVAVKVLKPDFAVDPKIAERFEQEARAASRIHHPNAIDVTDFGIDEGTTPFIVMELVKGVSLGEALSQNGPLSIERAANILRQACAAIEVAHSVGVIHRDIKPGNILIAEYDGSDWVEVADFGVAKIQEDVNRRASLTGANFIIGTPRYMSPEQGEGRPVDSRSDIYSLGVVLYEMLAGEPPFEAASSTGLLLAHASKQPAPLREKRPDLPAEIEAVVMRALEKDPDMRPQSALSFAREFEQAARLVAAEQSDAGRAGAFSRVSVPLNEAMIEESLLDEAQPAHATTRHESHWSDDEATIVRNQSYDKAATSADIAREPRGLRASVEAGSRETGEIETDARESKYRESEYEVDPTLPPGAAVRSKDSRAKRALQIAAVAGLLLLLAFAAFTIFRERPATQTSDAVAAASDDGIDSTPEPAPQPEKTAGDTADAEETEEVAKQAPTVDTGSARDQVEATLKGWAGTLEARNLNSHLSYYAPLLDRYYLKRGVGRSYVRADRARALSIYDKLDFDFSNIEVRVDSSGNRAVATFDKKWDFKGAKNSSGSVRERVWLLKTEGRWRITGERDLYVHRLNRE